LQVLDKLLGQADSKQVAFAKLAMANLHAYSAPSGKRKDDSIRKAETHYTHALELYRRVLEKDEGRGWLGLFVFTRLAQGQRRACVATAHAFLVAPCLGRAGCIFAANGIGCVLAELGNLSAAKEVFLQVGLAVLSSSKRIDLLCFVNRIWCARRWL
jgi:tetratricopeptide (TPR) repeat protein